MTKFKNPFLPFSGVAYQSAMLALEAQQVIALRLAKMALGGPAARREAELMVSEKLKATVQSGQMLAAAALTGTSHAVGDKVVKMVRHKVRANRKRLSGV